MTKIKPISVRTTSDLAAVLWLSPADAVEMDIREMLTEKIIDAFGRSGMTHAEIAGKVPMSRTCDLLRIIGL